MKRKIACLVLICSIIFLNACATSKVKYTTAELDALHNLVASNSFRIESDYAYPLATAALNSLSNAGLFLPGDTASRINLQGKSNFLTISGDSIQAQLPYYGELRIARSYGNSDVGITIENLLKEYDTEFNEKKNSYKLRFKANQDVENYQISIDIYPNNKTYININSTHRSTIAYLGNIVPVE